MSSATATSVFNQTDGDVDLNGLAGNENDDGKGCKVGVLLLFNADLID